ncbi:MAG TPA: TonB-dependent receptor [Longimicrobiaceae bacterium]|nr:TonB-dependent receptor [Longimicrobiaceae bacterium]
MPSKLVRTGLLLLALLAALPGAGAAQDAAGRIVGRVVDAGSGRPLTGVQVLVRNTGARAVSGVDGRFTVADAPAGTQALVATHIGYAAKTVTGVQVPAGGAVEVNVALEVEALALEGLTVSATRERGSVSRALDEQRNSVGVVNAITADQISRSPDSDAAQAVQRVSGVTVQDGKFVFVRGLGERYTVTDLNGARLPSPEPERKVVPLDLFPSGILQTVTTRKTFTPDLGGDFSGALVNIRTREFPTSRQLVVSASAGYNDAATGRDVLVAPRAGGEVWAAAAGSRGVPQAVAAAGGFTRDVPQQQVNQMVGAFRNAWLPAQGSGDPNLSLSASLGGSDPVFGQQLGYVVSGTYSRGQEVRTDERRALYDNTTGEAIDEFTSTLGTGRVSVLWGGVANLSALVGERHRFTSNNVYNRTADDEARTERGLNENLGLPLEIHRLRYVERTVRSNQVAGEHQLSSAHKLDWAVTSSGVTRSEPDRSEFIYELPGGLDSDRRAFLAGNTRAAVRTFGDLEESSLEGSANYTLTFGRGLRQHQVRVGGLLRSTERDAENRSYSIFNGGSQFLTEADRMLPAEQIFDGRYSGPDDSVFTIRPLLQGGSYRAEDRLTAGFAMADVAITERVHLVGGARVEHSDVEVSAVSQDGSTSLSTPAYTDVLPSLALNVDVSDAHKLRLSASQTLARPEYRELSPILSQDVLDGDNIQGNPELRRTLIRNLDARWEWYPSSGEIVSVGAFAKLFSDPIERVYLPTSGSRVLSFVNPESAYNYGVELEARKGLGSFAAALEPFSVSTNVTVMRSRIDAGSDSIAINSDRALVGQAPYVVNAGLTWAPGEGRTSATLLYNRVGERVYAAGARGLPDLIEQERSVLDLSLRVGVTEGFSAKLDARNLLDSPFQVVQGGVTREHYRSGRVVSVGMTWQP